MHAQFRTGKPDVTPRHPPEPLGSEAAPAAVLRRKLMDYLLDLRKSIKAKRLSLDNSYQLHASHQVYHHFIATNYFKLSHSIAFYIANRGEIASTLIMDKALALGKQCFLPVLHPLKKDYLWFMPYHTGDTLKPNRLGILEPIIGRHAPKAPWQIDLIIVPLVAFDNQCNRLGMGAGFYDRTFAFLQDNPAKPRTKLVGLAYEFQKVDSLKKQPWDIPLDAVVTEQTIYYSE